MNFATNSLDYLITQSHSITVFFYFLCLLSAFFFMRVLEKDGSNKIVKTSKIQ